MSALFDDGPRPDHRPPHPEKSTDTQFFGPWEKLAIVLGGYWLIFMFTLLIFAWCGVYGG